MSNFAAVGTLSRRNVALMANPRFFTAVLVVPLVYFLGFAAVLHKLLLGRVDFAMFFPPAIVVQVAMDAGITTAFFLAADRRDGVVDRLRSMPLPAAAFPAARLAVDALRFLASALVVVTAGTVIGFRFHGSPGDTALFWLVGLWFAIALSAITSAAGLRSVDPETVSSNLYLPYLPLLTLSTAFVPLAAFPGWMQPVAHWAPVSCIVDALRALAAGHVAAPVLGRAGAWLIGLSVIGALAATGSFRSAR